MMLPMMIYYSAKPIQRLTEIISQQAPVNIITGVPQGDHSMLHRLWMRFKDINFFVVEADGKLSPVTLKDRVLHKCQAWKMQRSDLYENSDYHLSFF